jgi:hypothetical protein
MRQSVRALRDAKFMADVVPRKQDSKSSKAGTKSENTAQPLQTKNWLRRKPGPQKRSRAVHEKMLGEAAGRKLKTISQSCNP